MDWLWQFQHLPLLNVLHNWLYVVVLQSIVCFIVVSPLLKYPLAMILVAITFVELCLYCMLRCVLSLLEALRSFCRSHTALRDSVRNGGDCNTYEEWKMKANLLDIQDHREAWKNTDESVLFDWKMCVRLRNEQCEQILAMEQEWGNDYAYFMDCLVQYKTSNGLLSFNKIMYIQDIEFLQRGMDVYDVRYVGSLGRYMRVVLPEYIVEKVNDIGSLSHCGCTLYVHHKFPAYKHRKQEQDSHILSDRKNDDEEDETGFTTPEQDTPRHRFQTQAKRLHRGWNASNSSNVLRHPMKKHLMKLRMLIRQAKRMRPEDDKSEDEEAAHSLLASEMKSKYEFQTSTLQGKDLFQRVVEILRVCSGDNVAGTLSTALYTHTNTGTKYIVASLTQHVSRAIELISQSIYMADEMTLTSPSVRKYSFSPIATYNNLLDDLSELHGHTALCLSGGAGLGVLHVGILSALFETNTLPHVISGTSAGSLFAAFAATRTKEEFYADQSTIHLQMGFDLGMQPLEILMKILATGVGFETDKWAPMITWFCKDLTFLEAFEHTGRVLVITATGAHASHGPLILSYRSAPDVLISSAIAASASVPILVNSITLQQRDRVSGQVRPVQMGGWGEKLRDGSIQCDLPINVLRSEYHCKFVQAVQVNPHIAPFRYSSKGEVSRRKGMWLGWRGGYIACLLESILRGLMYANINTQYEMEMVRFLGVDLSRLWMQHMSADQTIAADINWARDVLTIFTTPSEQEVQRKKRQGEVMIWTHMSLLEQRMKIGRALQQARNTVLKAKFTHKSVL